MGGHEDREFRRQLLSYLRKQLKIDEHGVPILSDLKIVDSQNHVLIQLVDMVAGTVRRFAERDKSDPPEYRALITHRIENI